MDSSPCGDWVAYKDEKCLKIFADRNFQTYESAKAICALSDREASPAVITIHSQDEQNFLENLLFNVNKVVHPVWIGAVLDSFTKKFQWENRRGAMKYENFAKLKNQVNYNCAEMISDGDQKGKWIDTLCASKNIVVCQKGQTKQVDNDIKKEFESFKKEFQQYKQQIESKLQTLQNSVPIGFVYVQLPSQSDPHSIWPNLKWQDITSLYANSFFRALGDKTAPFGKFQEEDAPNLVQVNVDVMKNYKDYDHRTVLTPGHWSDSILSGASALTHSNNTNYHYLKFFVQREEVRPQNTAVKIWKRIQ